MMTIIIIKKKKKTRQAKDGQGLCRSRCSKHFGHFSFSFDSPGVITYLSPRWQNFDAQLRLVLPHASEFRRFTDVTKYFPRRGKERIPHEFRVYVDFQKRDQSFLPLKSSFLAVFRLCYARITRRFAFESENKRMKIDRLLFEKSRLIRFLKTSGFLLHPIVSWSCQ